MAGNKCEHILGNGERCEAWALEGRDKCFSHDDSSREEKMIAVRKGGATKKAIVETPLRKISVTTPKDVIVLLSQVIDELRDGTLDVRVATGIGFLAGHLLRAFEITELNDKTEELKSIISERGLTKRRGLYE